MKIVTSTVRVIFNPDGGAGGRGVETIKLDISYIVPADGEAATSRPAKPEVKVVSVAKIARTLSIYILIVEPIILS
jgi:hypothetical protein